MIQQSFLFEASEQLPPAQPPESPEDGGDSPPPDDGTVSLVKAMRERYLNYALSVITSRALPDVRDGLKPVQRRILYAMWANLRLTHESRFRKSAAVVGEVMARFHPHGDQSIYDAMVRMAQPFSLRSPMVDGHGNFGSLDGDPPAAMRYTECRLQPLAAEMLDEIKKDTVPWRPNYDGSVDEPIVLPARIPHLLVNGSTGIAVGMATNIPPHNLTEVCDAAICMIGDPDIPTAELFEVFGGPDFPVGGELLNSRGELIEIYDSGRGSLKVRGGYSVEKVGRRRHLVITSIPYGLNKASIIERIGDLIRDGKVPQLTDVRDESTDDIRIVCELKRSASEEAAMAYLYKHTPLQQNFNLNLTVLLPTDNPEVGRPERVGLRDVLRHFLDFRFAVVRRRFEYELRKLRERIHILEGFEILFDALDEAIAIIRASDGKKDAARRLMERFPLDAIQTEAILELKLYKLARLEIQDVRDELAELRAEAARIEAILASDDALWRVVRDELREVITLHGDDRRTVLIGPQAEADFSATAYIVHRNSWVIVTRDGWIKCQNSFTDVGTIRVHDGDQVAVLFRASTRSTVTFFTDRGKAYVMHVDALPQTTGYGEPVQRFFNFADGERVVGVWSHDERNAPGYVHAIEVAPPVSEAPEPEQDEEDDVDTLRDAEPPPEPVTETVGPVAVAITRKGRGLVFPLSNHLDVSTKSGRRFCSLDRDGDGVVGIRAVRDAEDRVCLATEQGRALIFPALQLKFLQRSGKGVSAIKLGSGDIVLDFVLSHRVREGLKVQTSRGRDVVVRETKYACTKRGGKGIEVIKRGTLVRVTRPSRNLSPSGEGDEHDDEQLEHDDG